MSQVGRKRCNLLVTGGGGALLLFVYGVLRDERVRQIKKGTEKETFHPKCGTSCAVDCRSCDINIPDLDTILLNMGIKYKCI